MEFLLSDLFSDEIVEPRTIQHIVLYHVSNVKPTHPIDYGFYIPRSRHFHSCHECSNMRHNAKKHVYLLVMLTKLRNKWIAHLLFCHWPKNSHLSSNMVNTNTLTKDMHILSCRGFW